MNSAIRYKFIEMEKHLKILNSSMREWQIWTSTRRRVGRKKKGLEIERN